MKARVPCNVSSGSKATREYQVLLQLLLTCYTLHAHFGFGKERMIRFLQANMDDSIDLGDMKHGYVENRTWGDELWAWGEHNGLTDILTSNYGRK